MKEQEECTFHPQITPYEFKIQYPQNNPRNYENEIRRIRKGFEIKEEINKKLEMYTNLGKI